MTAPPLSPAPGLLSRRLPERRPVVLAAAAAGFAGVVAVSAAGGGPMAAVGALAAVPVLLVALELGLAAGLAASSGVAAALLLLAAPHGVDLLPGAVAVVAAGAVAGRFSDRMRAGHARERRLLDSGLSLSAAATRDGLAGAVAAAARAIPGVAGVEVHIDGAQAAASGRTRGDGTAADIVSRGIRLGRIGVTHDAPLEREDRAALQLLALQAALAADNQRLLAHERAAAALEAELRRARDELLEQRSGLARLLDAHEDDRRRVAESLHEELAQALAGVLLGLRMLRRDEPRAAGLPLDELRAQVVGVLDDVRDMATALRPPTLGQLGLVAALKALAAQSPGVVALAAEDVRDPLPEPLRTGAYRLIQQAVSAVRPGGRADVHLTATSRRLDVDLELDLDTPARAVADVRARAALLDGAVVAVPGAPGRTRIRVRLPLPGSTRGGSDSSVLGGTRP